MKRLGLFMLISAISYRRILYGAGIVPAQT